MTFVLQKLQKTAFASGAYILLNYHKCASEIAKNKTNLYKNSFCFRGFAPLTPTRALPLHPAGGFSPRPPYRLALPRLPLAYDHYLFHNYTTALNLTIASSIEVIFVKIFCVLIYLNHVFVEDPE